MVLTYLFVALRVLEVRQSKFMFEHLTQHSLMHTPIFVIWDSTIYMFGAYIHFNAQFRWLKICGIIIIISIS